MKADWPIGLTIADLRPITDEELAAEDWRGECPVLALSDGSTLYPSRDPEGNGPGKLFGVNNDGEQLIVGG